MITMVTDQLDGIFHTQTHCNYHYQIIIFMYDCPDGSLVVKTTKDNTDDRCFLLCVKVTSAAQAGDEVLEHLVNNGYVAG